MRHSTPCLGMDFCWLLSGQDYQSWCPTKRCKFCETYLSIVLPTSNHKCNGSHDDTSSSMESSLFRISLEDVDKMTNEAVSVGTLAFYAITVDYQKRGKLKLD